MTLEQKNSADDSGDGVDLAALLRLVRVNIRLVVGIAIAFLLATVAWTLVRGPVFDATAFVEVDNPKEVSTFAQKLRFPSVYLLGGENNAIEAQALARQTRVKVVRDSRLIAVTVRGSDAENVAATANKVVAAFIAGADKSGTAVTNVAVGGLSLTGISPGPYPQSPVVWLAEAANVPSQKAGPTAPLLWIAAAMAGVFSAFLFVLLRSS